LSQCCVRIAEKIFDGTNVLAYSSVEWTTREKSLIRTTLCSRYTEKPFCHKFPLSLTHTSFLSLSLFPSQSVCLSFPSLVYLSFHLSISLSSFMQSLSPSISVCQYHSSVVILTFFLSVSLSFSVFLSFSFFLSLLFLSQYLSMSFSISLSLSLSLS
jgi:hypothetical protein